MIEYLSLILAIPLGIFLSKLTKKEKEIYTRHQYFPAFLIVFGILSIYFFTTKNNLSLTTSFIFIMILSWWRTN